VALALKVERNWLIQGRGEVQGEEPMSSILMTASSPTLWTAAIRSSTSPCMGAISSNREQNTI
jgi:hypothetical protein